MAHTTFHEQAELLRSINRKVRMLSPFEKSEITKIIYALEELEKLKHGLLARAKTAAESEFNNEAEVEEETDATAESLAKLLGFTISK
jgi:hypothetical protein